MTSSTRAKVGNVAGLGGQWMQFVLCGWIAFRSGSYLYCSVYLLAVMAPSVLPFPKSRHLGILTPAGVLAMTLEPLSLPLISGAGLAVGVGAAACGRPLTLTAGISGGPSWAGAAASASCIFLPTAIGVTGSVWLAAALLGLAAVLGESHDRRGAVPPSLIPAAFMLAAVAGLRVLEPGFDSGSIRTPAAFATAWAIGAHIGWRAAPSADARAVLAAPFLAAMALTGLGSITGPGLVFLYGFLAACCGLVGGSGASESVGKMALSRRTLLVGAAAGALWANAPYDFQVLAWGTSGAVIFGGFASSIAARRVPAPRPMAASTEPPFITEIEELPTREMVEAGPIAGPLDEVAVSEMFAAEAPGEPPEEIDQRQVVELLLEATRTANRIRSAAITELRNARAEGLTAGSDKAEAREAIEDLLTSLTSMRNRLSVG